MSLAGRRRVLRTCLLVAFLTTASLICFTVSSVGASEQEATSGQTAHAAEQSEAGQESPCCGGLEGDDRPHVLAASYYSFRDDFAPDLLLNNKGPRPLEVRPTLFSTRGERYDVAPVTVEANSFRMVRTPEPTPSASAEGMVVG